MKLAILCSFVRLLLRAAVHTMETVGQNKDNVTFRKARQVAAKLLSTSLGLLHLITFLSAKQDFDANEKIEFSAQHCSMPLLLTLTLKLVIGVGWRRPFYASVYEQRT